MNSESTVYVPCNLCGADDCVILYHGTVGSESPTVVDYTSTVNKYGLYHDIVRCRSCGLVYMNPRDDNVTALYKDVVDSPYLESWKERARTFRDHIETVRKHKPQGNLLDIGCYAGIFLHEAQKAGYTVSGIEPSEWASEYARHKTGAHIVTGNCKEIHFNKETFDIVTLWDAIEHLEDPSLCLATVYDYLKEDGIVAITTHDIGSLAARVMSKMI